MREKGDKNKMGDKTGISWTDHTFNPWWGCFKVNDDCKNCYAETITKRFGEDIWGPSQNTGRKLFGEKHWAEPAKWNRHAEKTGVREKVFCASMADVFEEHPQVVSERSKLWKLIGQTPMLDWQLLTKRPENIPLMIPEEWIGNFPKNVWLGTSAGTQKSANTMVPALIASARLVIEKHTFTGPLLFVSVEPQTEYVDLTRWLWMLDWVIVGGESGPHHRPFDPAWTIPMRHDCDIRGVAFWFKQHGGPKSTSGGHLLEGQEYHAFPRV